MITELWVKGCDVSSFQGVIDFERMAQTGVKAVCIRAGFGYYPDANFVTNANNAKAAGLAVSAYWYIYPQNNMIYAASKFVEQLDKVQIDWRVWCDEEEHSGRSRRQLRVDFLEFAEAVKAAGYSIAHYTRASFFDYYVEDHPDFAFDPVVVAHYGATNPAVPRTWTSRGRTWSAWQYSADGNNCGRPHGASSSAIDMLFIKRELLAVDVPTANGKLNAHNLPAELAFVS